LARLVEQCNLLSLGLGDAQFGEGSQVCRFAVAVEVINEVQAQTGKGITAFAAAILIADAEYLIANCP
jgi:hypothetical protein